MIFARPKEDTGLIGAGAWLGIVFGLLTSFGGCASAPRGSTAPGPPAPALSAAASAAAPSKPPARGTSTSFGAAFARCLQDDDIPPEDRGAVERAARAFASAWLGSAPDSARDLMTREAQENVSAEKLGAMIAPLDHARGDLRDFTLTHTYLVETTGVGPDARAMCGVVANNQGVSVTARIGTRQAHVSFTIHTLNNDLALSLWLLPEDGRWKILFCHLDIASISGQDASAIFALAKQERRAGHTFNAAVLYGMMRELLQRGPTLELGLAQTASEDAKTFDVPDDMLGGAPFFWRLGAATYKIGAVSPVGVEGQLGLAFVLPQDTWSTTEAADAGNRKFLTAFVAAHPEVLGVFRFLVARAERPDGTGGYATVYRADRGFK